MRPDQGARYDSMVDPVIRVAISTYEAFGGADKLIANIEDSHAMVVTNDSYLVFLCGP